MPHGMPSAGRETLELRDSHALPRCGWRRVGRPAIRLDEVGECRVAALVRNLRVADRVREQE